MKAFVLSGCVTALLCACAEKDQTQIKVPWPPGVAYVPVCKPMVKYQGTSFEIQGVKVPDYADSRLLFPVNLSAARLLHYG